MRRWTRWLIRFIYVFLGILLVFEMLKYNTDVPSVEKEKSFVTKEAEELTEKLHVDAVDATYDHIFLSHGQNGLISVFDWNGNYCFTIVTSAEGNGLPELYCCGNTAFILDKNGHVFVYEGAALEQDYQIESLSQGNSLRSALRGNKNNFVSLEGRSVVNKDGHVILRISKTGYFSDVSSLLITVTLLSLLFFCFLAHSRRRTKDCSLARNKEKTS